MSPHRPQSQPVPPARLAFLGSDADARQALRVLDTQLRDLTDEVETHLAGRDDVAPPGDDPRAADAFLDARRPDMIVLAGAVLPAALIERAAARAIPLVLVEAAHPVLSGRRRLLPGRTRAVLRHFAAIHAVDQASAAVLSRLVRGAVAVHATGRLARHPQAPACNASELDAMRTAVGARPSWFAHGLPIDEADATLLAHAHALRRAHRLLLIVQPDDATRGRALADRARDVGFTVARRALDEDIRETTQVYIADTDDDPGLFLRLAPLAYLGGSLTPGTPSPPAERAAALGSALVFGPHAEPGQRDFLDALVAVGGARRIPTASALGEAVTALLSPELGASAALKAWTLATEGSEATYAVARALCDWIVLNHGPRR